MHGDIAPPSADDEFISPELASTWAVLRRGLRQSPQLRTGLGFTAILAVTVTVANLITPILVQLIFDHGFEGGFRPAFVYTICAVGFATIVVAYLAGRMSARRLVTTSEAALADLRVETFAHIHELSIAEQTKEKRGVFVSRVTADVDSLAHFTEWGGIAWILSIAQILGTLVLMLLYSWQLTVPVVVLVIPLLLVVGYLQAGFSSAYTAVRTRVGEMLSEVSESVMGAAVVRAYGLDESIDRRVKRAIGDRYRAQMVAHRRASTLFPMAVLFWALALAAIVIVGTIYGREWGLTIGRISAFLFLAQLFLDPFSDLPEIYSETQTAIAGWRKILSVLDLPVEITEPADGVVLPRGALEVVADDVRYAYPGSAHVLHGVYAAGSGRRERGDRGRDRVRQDDVREAADAPGRPGGGRDPGGRGGPAPGGARVPARGRPHGAAGRVPLRRDRPGQRPVRPRGRHRPGRGHRVRGARARRLGGIACPRAWTRSWASAARR